MVGWPAFRLWEEGRLAPPSGGRQSMRFVQPRSRRCRPQRYQAGGAAERARQAEQERAAQLRLAGELSLARYNQGLANYFEVLQAQQELFPAEFDLSEARLEERLAVIRLYLALGGGWQLGLNWLPEAEEPKEDPAPPSDF